MDALIAPGVTFDDVEHFKSIPWCAKQLAEPNLIVRRSWNRTLGPGLKDSLYSVTLNNPYALASLLIFYPDPDTAPDGPQPSIPEVKTFVTLGPLITGFAGVCHGGIVMTLLDEALSALVQVNRDRGAIKGRQGLMTAYLNTTFIRPVHAPGTYLVTARLEKVEGRKAYGSVWVEDEHGAKLTKGEGLFVMLREKL